MRWIFTGTGRYSCDDGMGASTSGSLDKCKTFCKTIGGTRLTHYSSSDYCECCLASGELIQGTGKIYKLEGKYYIHK